MKYTMSGYNGETAVKSNGKHRIPRAVLVRNVMDILEGNEAYGNLSFCEAQMITDLATNEELLTLYTMMYDDKPCMDLIVKILERE